MAAPFLYARYWPNLEFIVKSEVLTTRTIIYTYTWIKFKIERLKVDFNPYESEFPFLSN